jgi:hypothetical protein
MSEYSIKGEQLNPLHVHACKISTVVGCLLVTNSQMSILRIKGQSGSIEVAFYFNYFANCSVFRRFLEAVVYFVLYSVWI